MKSTRNKFLIPAGLFIALLVAAITWASALGHNREKLYYIENGIISTSANGRAHSLGIPASFFWQQNARYIVFATKTSSWPEAWIFDKNSGKATMLSNAVSMIAMSPDSTKIAITNPHSRLSIAPIDGSSSSLEIPGHAGSAAFSNDGQKIAYMKLSESAKDIYPDSPSMFIGIAVLDLRKKTEKIIAEAVPGDFGVSAWSPDDSLIYFQSNKNDLRKDGVGALFSVPVNGGHRIQETNKTPDDLPTPPIYSGTYWLPEEGFAISDGDGIWAHSLDADYHFIESKRLGSGKFLQPAEKGRLLTYLDAESPLNWRTFNPNRLVPN